MPEFRIFDGGTVAIRDTDNDGRTIEGYAYRWGELSRGGTPETGGRREGFDKGAFTEAIASRGDRPWPFMSAHQTKGGKAIGGIHFREDDTGLAYSGRLMDNDAAREYSAAATEAGQNEVSLELMLDPSAMRRKGDAVIHSRVARIAALAGAHFAAYEGAQVAIREEANVATETTETVEVGGETAKVFAGPVALSREETVALATRAAEDVGRSFMEHIANAAGGKAPDKFAAYRSLGELMVACRDGDIPIGYIHELAERALADIVSTAGANAALLTGNLTVRGVVGIVSRGRPAITAFGGPRPLPDTGLSVTWPYYDGTLTDHVGAQSAEKAEITSATVNIKLGTEALVTYAGGADIAFQLIRQGDPSILDIFGRIVLTAWGVVTDAAFVTELETGSVTKDMETAVGTLTFANLVSHTIDMSLTVETATGQPADFVLASSTAFAAFAKLIAAASTQVVLSGGLDLANLRLAIGNVPLLHAPSITAGKAIVSNRLAASWHEAGPFQVSATDVAKLGQNVAWWSMGAGARYVPAGIIEYYDVTP